MTLVSYAHNFIYLRTRKTASTSTELYLQAYCVPPGQKVSEFQTHPIVSKYGIAGRRRKERALKWHQKPRHLWHVMNGTNIWCPHMAADTVRAGLARGFWEKALKISSVRNPFKRMISSYYWAEERNNRADERSADEHIEGFRRKVRNCDFKTDKDIVFLDGEFLPDALIRQEHLAEDLKELGDRLELDPTLATLRVTKKTKSSEANQRPAVSEFYDDETADIVRSSFDWVFKHAGYSPEIPE